MNDDVKLNKDNMCKCGKNPASDEEHCCPYQEDVFNDCEFKCQCCDDCWQICADDI